MQRLLLFLAFFGILSFSVFGQFNGPYPPSSDSSHYFPYFAKAGDNTWDLADSYYSDGRKWTKLALDNPFLDAPGRIWVDEGNGKLICKLIPGEKIWIDYDYVAFPKVMSSPEDERALAKLESLSAPEKPWIDSDTLAYLIFGLFMAIPILIYIFMRLKRERRDFNPALAGPPMRQGGVSDSEAPTYANGVAQRVFNTPGLTVRNVVRGRLTGKDMRVYFAGRVEPRTLTFTNQPAYRGEVTVDGRQEFVYFLQACGNDVTAGNYYRGDRVLFEVDAVLPANQLANVTTEASTTDTPVDVKTEESPKNTGETSEYHQQVTKVLEIAKAFLEGDKEKHKFEITLTPTEVHVSVENKFMSQKKA